MAYNPGVGEHERTVSVSASPDEAFRLLADPGNLPRYVATMVAAEPEDEERVRVAAEVLGRREEGQARLHADEAARRLEWSAERAGDYRGWLQVEPSDSGSRVTVHVHAVRDEDPAEAERALDETAANIERLLAG